MNMLKKGPNINLRELKVPTALLDLFYDLRERHLLPLAAVLVVAIVAVPIALSQSSASQPPNGNAAVALAVSNATTSHKGELVVAQSPLGLRPFRRRLGYLSARDPFQQLYPKVTATSKKGGESSASTSSSESSSESSTAPTPAPTHTEGGTHHLIYFSWAIDVRVVSGGSPKKSRSSHKKEGKTSVSKSKSVVRRNLPEFTVLPSSKEPALDFIGVSKDGKKALMLVSSSVNSEFGEGLCVLGTQSCQLMALEPGLPETFVFGPKNRTFKIELLKVHLVVSNKRHIAPLGH